MNSSSPPSTCFSKSHSSPHCFCKLPSLDKSFPAFKGSSFSSLSTCTFWETLLKNMVFVSLATSQASGHQHWQVFKSTTYKTRTMETLALPTCLSSQRGDVIRRVETMRRNGKAGRRINCLYTPISTLQTIQDKCFSTDNTLLGPRFTFSPFFHFRLCGNFFFVVLGAVSQLRVALTAYE